MLRNRECVGIMARHAQSKRLQATQHSICGIGVQGCTGDLAEVVYLTHEFRATRYQARQHIRMAGKKLRCAVDDQVHSERRGRLVHGRRECVIGNDHGTTRMRGSRQALDVNNLQSRIGRRFEVQHATAAFQLALDRSRIGRIAQLCLDREARQELLKQHVCAAVSILNADDTIAWR